MKMKLCAYPGCERRRLDSWTTCPHHYSAGRTTARKGRGSRLSVPHRDKTKYHRPSQRGEV